MLTLMIWLTVAAVPPGFLKPLGRMRMVKGVPGICIALEGRVGMTRAIVDQKLSALLSAEVRLERTERTSPTFDEICARYRKAEDEYNESFDACWHGAASQSL